MPQETASADAGASTARDATASLPDFDAAAVVDAASDPPDAAPSGDAQAPVDASFPQLCGLTTGPCGEGEFCSFADTDACGEADLGVCQESPASCPDSECEEPAVCGCDGRLYCSECSARAAGVDIASPEYCAEAAIRCGSWLGEQCSDDQHCDFADIFCGTVAPGRCLEKPAVDCPLEVNEICGCDGNLYDNECHANKAGTDRHRFISECR